jgi:vacuolar-type H+-ATPase subunit E/Vma4
MKKNLKHKLTLTSQKTMTIKPTDKEQYQYDTNLDNLNPIDKENIERRIKEIENKIEDIGVICDRKKEKSLEDYNNVLKSNKAQFQDELTKLKFKLMETLKQNTREDFLNKLKKDLGGIKNQVYDKDKELQSMGNFYF